MKIKLLPLLLLALVGCASSTAPPLTYVQGDRDTYTSFGPVVARDVAAGHVDTQMAYTSWRIRLESAERAIAPTTQPK